MITRINEANRLKKYISCDCECKTDGRKYNSNQKWNNNKCWRECKNRIKKRVCKGDCAWNPTVCTCEW